MSNIVKQVNTLIGTKRRGNPAWVKGMKSPNPKGQALGREYLQALLKKGFDKDAKYNKENLIEYAFKQARIDNTVLIAILKKLLPGADSNGKGNVIIQITNGYRNNHTSIISPIRSEVGAGQSA